MSKLTHLDATGAARMVDVGGKAVTRREAAATARISMRQETFELLEQGAHDKGDVLAVARVAGIQAAKKCSDLIPLCHPLMISSVNVDFELDAAAHCVHIVCRCRVDGKTGVEMEALTGASVAALTIYDMCKAVDRGMVIDDLAVLDKQGGDSGAWRRPAREGS